MEGAKGSYQVGKLVLVVGSRTKLGRKYIGRVLTLSKYIPQLTHVMHMGERFYCLESDAWAVVGDNIESPNGVKGVCAFRTSHLMPIDDPDLGVDTKQKEKDLELEKL